MLGFEWKVNKQVLTIRYLGVPTNLVNDFIGLLSTLNPEKVYNIILNKINHYTNMFVNHYTNIWNT